MEELNNEDRIVLNQIFTVMKRTNSMDDIVNQNNQNPIKNINLIRDNLINTSDGILIAEKLDSIISKLMKYDYILCSDYVHNHITEKTDSYVFVTPIIKPVYIWNITEKGLILLGKPKISNISVDIV